MAQQPINVGTLPNDGTGDQIRVAFGKVNTMFAEVYGLVGAAPAPTTYVLPAATGTALGGVKAGPGVTVATDGTLSVSTSWVTQAQLTTALAALPVVPALATVAISGKYTDLTGAPVIPAPYALPTASSATLGGVKIGTGLTVAQDGTLSAIAAAGTAGVASFNTRTGAISLAATDVTGALGFTPYSANNPSAYQTAAQVTAAIQGVVGAAPAALATLAAIDAQMANDESAAAALTTTVAGKLAISANLADLGSAASARTNLGLGTAALATAGVSAVRTVTATTTMTATDEVLVVNAAAALTITLPPNPVAGRRVKVMDGNGQSGTFNITVSGGSGVTINGAATAVLNSGYDSFDFLFKGSEWGIA